MKLLLILACLLTSVYWSFAQNTEELYSKAKTYYFTQPDSVITIADILDSATSDKDLNHARANHLRGVMQQLRSESDSALKLFHKMEVYAEKVPDSTLLTIAKLSKGLMLANKGILDSAMYYYVEGERIATLIQAENYRQRAMAEIARLLSMKGEHEAALTKYRQYYQLVKDSPNPNDLATAYAYIGAEFMFFQNHDSSLYYINKALVLQKQLGNIPGIAAAQLNKGSIYQELQMLDSAIFYFQQAGLNYKIAGFTQGLGQLNLNKATMELNLGKWEQAQKSLKEALKYSQMIGDLHAMVEENRLLSSAFFENGQTDSAYAALQKHVSLKDSLLNIEKNRAISELEAKYETEKREQQIALQATQLSEQAAQNQRNVIAIFGLLLLILALIIIFVLNRSRSKKKQALLLAEAENILREKEIEAAITSQEKERSRFAKDLHDGFGQMISILNLNLKSLEDDGKDKHEVFENSSKVLEEMYQELKSICFNLMPQTLIKHGIKAALNEFAARINTAEKLYVETDFFGLEERLTEVQEISLYRISQEWMNNIMKYSDANKATIQITKDANEITLMIEDDGTGFDMELLKSGKGNGWRNMNSRANLINGELEIDTTKGIKGNTLIVNASSIASEDPAPIISNYQ